MPLSNELTVHNAPKVGVEKFALLLERHVDALAENRYSRVVYPGVKTTEAVNSLTSGLFKLRRIANVGNRIIDSCTGFCFIFQFIGGQYLARCRSRHG